MAATRGIFLNAILVFLLEVFEGETATLQYKIHTFVISQLMYMVKLKSGNHDLMHVGIIVIHHSAQSLH